MLKESFKKGLPGSASSALDFGLQQRAYNEQLPLRIIQRKAEVETAQKKVILGGAKPEWNPHTNDDDYIFPKPAIKRACAIGQSIPPIINYRAETLPPCPPVLPLRSSKLQLPGEVTADRRLLAGMGTTTHRVEPPNHPSLVSALPFNLSTEVDGKTRARNYTQAHDVAARNSQAKAAALTKHRTGIYERELNREAAIRDKKRQERLAQLALAGTLHKGEEAQAVAPAIFADMPTVFAPVESIDLATRGMAASTRSKLTSAISYVWEHTGSWEQSPFEKPGKLAWSCCMSGERDSKGCKSKQMRLEGWQYVSYG